VIDLKTMNTAEGPVLWARLWGQWAGANFDRLAARIGALALPAGSRVILDFSAIDHLDFRAVPHLVRLGPCVESCQGSLRVVGLSAYVSRIVVFGGALEGREFLERYVAGDAAHLRPGSLAGRCAARSGRRARDTESVAQWVRSLGAPAPALSLGRRPRLRRGQSGGGGALRRVRLADFAALAELSRN